MKTQIWIGGAALLTLGVFLGQSVFSQEKKHDEHKVSEEEAMKIWMDMGTPGEPHKALNDFVGKWDTHSKFWMAGEGNGPAMESKGNSEVKWAFDGRFLMEEATGSFMGMPFKGMGLRGYDNYRKEYLSMWVDSMGTALYTARGQMDAKTKTLTMEGLMDDPSLNQKDKTARWVYKIVDSNKIVFEMHDPDILAHGGKSSKCGEITYTRKSMN